VKYTDVFASVFYCVYAKRGDNRLTSIKVISKDNYGIFETQTCVVS